MATEVDDWEEHARRAKFQQIAGAQESDPERMAELEKVRPQRAARREEALAILDRFNASGDVDAFRSELDLWSRQPGYSSFGGVNGQMFVNQLVNGPAPKTMVADLLWRTLTVPTSTDHAEQKLDDLVAFVQKVKRGAHPAPKRAPFVASFLWSLQDHQRWPCMWPSAERMLTRLGWLPPLAGPLAPYYLEFREVVLSLRHDPAEVEHALFWMERHPFVGVDPRLVERCRRANQLNRRGTEDLPLAEANARAVLGDLALLGQGARALVEEVLRRPVTVKLPPLRRPHAVPVRTDGWVAWRAQAGDGPALRVWATAQGVYIGVHPGWIRDDWYKEALAAAGPLPDGWGAFMVRGMASDVRLVPTRVGSVPGEFFLGRPLASTEAGAVLADVRAGAHESKRVIDAMVAAAARTATTAEGVEADAGPAPPLSDLAALVEKFKRERPYPTVEDLADIAERERMAATIAPGELLLGDVTGIRRIVNSRKYGFPGPQANFNTTMRDADPAALDAVLRALDYLLWNTDDDDATRIDRLLDPEDLGAPGLADGVIMKLLAVAHPERYITVYPLTGPSGKLALMRLIGLEPPDPDLSRGRRHVEANDRIRERLQPYLPNDPRGMGKFLYWLAREPQEDVADVVDPIGDLVGELYLKDRTTLETIVTLLREKGQVVFYGPPGTGKTYVARALAKALAPDPDRRRIVQFHPATSYEDFFEGYRPVDDGKGGLTYRIVKGPLALLAEHCETDAAEHVLVIDEINRANLPKVLGELLFLLEYRDEEVATLYRPDDLFRLPKNLLVIGTMNTADRSVALIDAALRRRFHFIPFFPHEGDMEGLLERWLAANGEPGWVGEFVEFVNADLERDLQGAHLQIGPSHFMRKGLSEQVVQQIWTYDVYPFIEDQLFGEADRLEPYKFEKAYARFVQATSLLPGPEGGGGGEPAP